MGNEINYNKQVASYLWVASCTWKLELQESHGQGKS
jgi:hypothetical protein